MEYNNLIEKYSFKGLPRLPEEEYIEFLNQVKKSFKALGQTEFIAEYFGTKVTVKYIKSSCHRENGRFITVNRFRIIKPQDSSMDKALREARLLVKKSRHFKGSKRDFLQTFL